MWGRFTCMVRCMESCQTKDWGLVNFVIVCDLLNLYDVISLSLFLEYLPNLRALMKTPVVKHAATYELVLVHHFLLPLPERLLRWRQLFGFCHLLYLQRVQVWFIIQDSA